MIDPARDLPRQLPWFAPPSFGTPPVGSVIAFAGTLGTPVPNTASPANVQPAPTGSPPAVTAPIEAWGWMACDGRTLRVGDYQELFAVLGHLYGGSGDTFRLPDYRGYFLRGVDWGAGNDPDAATRTAPAGGTAADVGAIQPSALRSHKHDYPRTQQAVIARDGTAAGVPVAQQSDLTSVPVADDGSTLSAQLSASETRPLNIAVAYLIKFTAALRPGMPFPS